MAFLYKRPRSPFWWVRWVTVEGEKKQESTGFRHGIPAETRKAREVCARKELQEVSTPKAGDSSWATWVPAFLEARYSNAPATKARMVGGWSTVSMYLAQVGVHTPAGLKREHCLGFIPWRRTTGHMNKKGGMGKPVSHNTALLELRVLSVVMTEAVHRGIVQHSPTWKLGVRKNPPKEKGELTEHHVRVLREEIARVKEEDPKLGHFFNVSFEIAMAQGWRLHETYLDLEQVNLESLTVYRVQKGGRSIASPLNPALIPLFNRLRAERRIHTYEQPKIPSLEWFKLFHRIREKDPSFARVSFHSTRVTVVSKLLNAGVGQPSVMKMVGHASATINRLYHRLPSAEAAQIFRVLDSSRVDRKPESSGSPEGTPPLG